MTKILILTLILSFLLLSCNAIKPKKVDSRNVPSSGIEKAKKNVAEGRGASVGGLLGNRGGSFEFSSSNPMWRASLEVLDFLPMTTVDYSGGMIISDWYNDDNVKGDESIKISIRFLANEVRSDSLKIIIHKKKCASMQNCKITMLENSKISNELRSTILRTAASLEKQDKKKKK